MLGGMDNFDPTDTTNWQRSGSTVFLLEEIPGRWEGRGANRRSATQNKYTLQVSSMGGEIRPAKRLWRSESSKP